MRLARAVRVRVVDAVSPADCLPLAVGALRARWKVLGRVDIKLVAAVGALVGAGRRVAAGGYRVSHVAPPLALRITPGWAWTNVARPVRWNAVVRRAWGEVALKRAGLSSWWRSVLGAPGWVERGAHFSFGAWVRRVFIGAVSASQFHAHSAPPRAER